jgi:death-on-curing protein
VSGSPYLYLTSSQIRELHDTIIREYGGADGLRDFASIESSVEAPQKVAYFEGGDVFDQASAYAYSIVQSRHFKDGNRRTALAVALVFLEINGVLDHAYDQPTLLEAVLHLAAGAMNAELFAQFLRDAVSGTTGTWEDA